MSVLARITRALGFNSKAGKLSPSNRGRVVKDQSLWEQGGRIGGGLTPRQVSDIIRAADGGDLSRLMDLANECRQKDCHLQAVLGVGEESIAGLKWQIVLPEDARAKDKRAAKWVEQTLRATPAFQRLIACLAGATYYGFDVNEIVWAKVGGKLVPIEFAHLAHRRFAFRASDGSFVLRDTGMPQDGIDFRAEWPNKFIVSEPRVTGDAPQREGLCRPLVWAALFRTWTVADWLKTAELSWKPWRIGKYKKTGTGNEDRDDLENVLDRLSTNGWAAMADTSDIKIEWPGGSTSTKATHSELVNVIAMEMSKCVLGQTETVQSSSSSGYGQAKVHDSVRKDLAESRARQIAADLTRDLIGPMTSLNFGECISGRFEFITEDGIDLKAFAEAMDKLVSAGLKTIPEAWVRDRCGIPEPKKGEATLGAMPEPDPLIPIDEQPVEDANGKPPASDNPKPAPPKKPPPKPQPKPKK